MNKHAADGRVFIFDTTLRDGEQSPGCSMTLKEKLRVASALDTLGVDIIEAGFPAASDGDSRAVAAIAGLGLKATICGLARCHFPDIDAVADALRDCDRRRLHVFIATSPLHREYKLKMSPDEVIQRAVAAIEHGRPAFQSIEFSAEDAGRTEKEFLLQVFQAALDAGARVLNVPDTVGYLTPAEIGKLFKYLHEGLRCREAFTLSCHCHDDLGLAVANSLSALEHGARQVECTVNGIGERAGNCSLEEVVMALNTRADRFGLNTAIDTRQLYPASRVVSSVTGNMVPPNKAIVGANAFAHESGIHQDGMLKHRQAYEIIDPTDVGISESQLVLGKHSGRHAFRQRLETLNIQPDDVGFEALFKAFKQLADQKKYVYDEDIEALWLGDNQDGPWRLWAINIETEAGVESRNPRHKASATVRLLHHGAAPRSFRGSGDGPVNAVFNALRQTVDENIELMDFVVKSISAGDDAQGQASIKASIGRNQYQSNSTSTDIVEASALALINVINRHLRNQETDCGQPQAQRA